MKNASSAGALNSSASAASSSSSSGATARPPVTVKPSVSAMASLRGIQKARGSAERGSVNTAISENDNAGTATSESAVSNSATEEAAVTSTSASTTTSSRALPPPPAVKGPAPSRPKGRVFAVGDKAQAQYSGDGKWYSVVIEEVKEGEYLVRYVDFNDDKEWRPANLVK